jgi:hypothetical protein
MEVRMRDLRLGVLRSLVIAAILVLGSSPAFAQVQTELEGSMAVMSEAVAGVVTTMIQAAQCDTNSNVRYKAVFTPAQAMADISGTFAGMNVAVHVSSFFDVFYDLQYNGSAGDLSFVGMGQAALSAGRDIMILSAAASSATAFPWDVHVIKDYRQVIVPKGIQIRDDGLVVITRAGRPIAKYKQTSIFQRYPPFRRQLTKKRIAPNLGCTAYFTELIDASGSALTGTVKLKAQ